MTPIEQVFKIIKDFFQMIINLCRTNTNKFHSRYFKFASGQLNNVSVRPYCEHHDLNIRWLLCCKSYKPCCMDLYVCEMNFKDLFYYRSKRLFHSLAFSCSKHFRYSVQNLKKFRFILRLNCCRSSQSLDHKAHKFSYRD